MLKAAQWKYFRRTPNSEKYFTKVHIYDTHADELPFGVMPTLCGERFYPDDSEYYPAGRECKKCKKLAGNREVFKRTKQY